MKTQDCEGCKFLQTTTYKSVTLYECLHKGKPIHLFEDCPKDKPMTTLGFIGAVKSKLLGMIGDGKDTDGSLRNVVKWIESIENDAKKK